MSQDVDYSFVCILDVLAYKNSLKKDRDNGNLKFKDQLTRALSTLSRVNEAVFNYQAISDTIIISCRDKSKFFDFLGLIKRVFIAFLKEGLLVRGGVSYNQHFKSQVVTYSFALSSAYELEHDRAIFPRVLIDPNIISMMHESGTKSWRKLIFRENGTYYLNIIDKSNFDSVVEYFRRTYESSKSEILSNEAVFLKYKWFELLLKNSTFASGPIQIIEEPVLL